MKRLFLSTTIAVALALAASPAFAGQRRGGGGHTSVGHAIPRSSAPAPARGGHGGRVVVGPGYYGGLYAPAYGWGYYDPYFDPLWGAYGWGVPYAYGYGAPAAVTGGLRLEVKPSDAQVFVDGNYVGTVDDFDGHFQHVDLPPGGHHVEIRADGFAPLAFDTYIQPDHTTDCEGHLTPLS